MEIIIKTVNVEKNKKTVLAKCSKFTSSKLKVMQVKLSIIKIKKVQFKAMKILLLLIFILIKNFFNSVIVGKVLMEHIVIAEKKEAANL